MEREIYFDCIDRATVMYVVVRGMLTLLEESGTSTMRGERQTYNAVCSALYWLERETAALVREEMEKG